MPTSCARPKAIGLPEPVKPSKKQVTALAKAIDALAKPHLDPDELEDREAERLHDAGAREACAPRGRGADRRRRRRGRRRAAGGGKVVDLMQLLRRSLGAGGGKGAGR